MNDRTTPTPPTTSTEPRWLTPVLLAAFTFALYARSLAHGLTNWDDPTYVETNPIASQGLSGLVSAFTTPFDGAWYPLTQVAYTLIRLVAGPSPLAHHLVQTVVFAVAVALVPSALAAFGVPRKLGVAAAVLWAVHPMRVESVVWAANLKDALSLLGVVASFALYGRGSRAASAVAFALALLAKSMVFPVAVLFALLEWRGGVRPVRAVTRATPWLLPALAVALVAGTLHFQQSPLAWRQHPGGSLVASIPSILWLPWWYLGRQLAPLHPQAIYAFDAVRWLDWRLAVAALGWAATAGWIVTRAPETRRHWLLGVAGWWLPFATVTGLAPMRFLVSDRYSLLPALALAAAIVVGLHRLARRRWQPTAAVGVMAVALLPGNVLRQGEWKSSVALWEANRPHAQSAWAVHYNLAGAYGGEGRWAEAIRELDQTRRLAPGEKQPIGDLVFAYLARAGVSFTQIQQYRAALAQAGYEPAALVRAADSLVAEGQQDAAQMLLRIAQEGGDRADVHAVLARLALARTRWQEAEQEARTALRLDPAAESSRVDLTIALAELGRFDEALEASVRPARATKINAMLQGARAYALMKAGRNFEAHELLEEAKRELQAP